MTITETKTCSASGDPHYTTYDGRKFDFMGSCRYLLSGSKAQDINNFFKVITENEQRNGNPSVSWVKSATVIFKHPEHGEISIELNREPLSAKVSKYSEGFLSPF